MQNIGELRLKVSVSVIGVGKSFWKLKVLAFVASILGVHLIPHIETEDKE